MERRRDTDRDPGRTPSDDRDWSEVSTNEGTQRIADPHQELEGNPQTDPSSEHPKQAKPTETLKLDF